MKKTVMLVGIIATLGMFSCTDTKNDTINTDEVIGQIDQLIDSVTNQIEDSVVIEHIDSVIKDELKPIE